MEFNKVAVIGAGTMGAGIAQWFCQQSIKAQLIDVSIEQSKNAKDKIYKSWDKLLEKGKFNSSQITQFKDNLEVLTLDKIDSQTDLIIEAIVEKLDVKKDLFKKLDQKCLDKTIFATNTSSLSIGQIGLELPAKRQEKTIGLHFFNPAPIMKLVEIIPGPESSTQLTRNLYEWFQEKGKKPALCQDSPGFIVNRVARNFYGESLRLASYDDQSRFKEIDQTLKSCGGFRMGPFELMDLIGIDVNYEVTQSVWRSFFQEPRFAPHLLQRQMVQSGRFGQKTKRGFYRYE